MYIDTVNPLELVQPAAFHLRDRWQTPIDVCVIAGSGLSSVASLGDVADSVDLGTVRGLVVPGVAGHGGAVVLTSIAGARCMVFTGRLHGYEGHSPSTCATYPALAIALGAKRVLFTQAVGGLHHSLRTGTVMLPIDGLNFTNRRIAAADTTARATIIDPEWHRQVVFECTARGIGVAEGTVAQVMGPSYETRSEVRMLRGMGADAVGMSTLTEAIWCASVGCSVLVVSLITNVLTDTVCSPLTHHDVVATSQSSQENVCSVVESALSVPL